MRGSVGAFLLGMGLSASSASVALVLRPDVSVPDSSVNCGLRNSGVQDYRDLVEKVNIKIAPGDDPNDPDTREVSSKYPATMPLVCEMPEGGTSVVGTANYLEGKRVATVLHTVMDPSSCSSIVKMNTCSLFDGKKTYPFSWEQDPEALCNKLNGLGDDFIITGKLKQKIPGRTPYTVTCVKDLSKLDQLEVVVVGASATNYSKGPRPKYGKETLVSKGMSYGTAEFGEKPFLKYSNDTGPITSGGALLVKMDGKYKLIGLNRGDYLDGEQNMNFLASGNSDGYAADKENNYSTGILFGGELGCR